MSSISSVFNRKYEMNQAIKDVSFTISPGEFVGFIGPNGAGKTTTLKILSGILFPSGGEVYVDGFVPSRKESTFLKSISLITAKKNSLWWDIPAKDSFAINRVIYEVNDLDFEDRIKELSLMLDVFHLLEIPVKNLSLGERMKLEIIMALIHNPRIIFLDEPTIGLDFISRKKIRNFLVNYQAKHQATIILTSHYFEDIVDLCRRVIVINNGSIVNDSSLSSMQDQYKNYKILRIWSKDLQEYKRKFEKDIIDENMEFVDCLLPHSEVAGIVNGSIKDQFEVRPISLEAIVKKHYENS